MKKITYLILIVMLSLCKYQIFADENHLIDLPEQIKAVRYIDNNIMLVDTKTDGQSVLNTDGEYVLPRHIAFKKVDKFGNFIITEQIDKERKLHKSIYSLEGKKMGFNIEYYTVLSPNFVEIYGGKENFVLTAGGQKIEESPLVANDNLIITKDLSNKQSLWNKQGNLLFSKYDKITNFSLNKNLQYLIGEKDNLVYLLTIENKKENLLKTQISDVETDNLILDNNTIILKRVDSKIHRYIYDIKTKRETELQLNYSLTGSKFHPNYLDGLYGLSNTENISYVDKYGVEYFSTKIENKKISKIVNKQIVIQNPKSLWGLYYIDEKFKLNKITESIYKDKKIFDNGAFLLKKNNKKFDLYFSKTIFIKDIDYAYGPYGTQVLFTKNEGMGILDCKKGLLVNKYKDITDKYNSGIYRLQDKNNNILYMDRNGKFLLDILVKKGSHFFDNRAIIKDELCSKIINKDGRIIKTLNMYNKPFLYKNRDNKYEDGILKIKGKMFNKIIDKNGKILKILDFDFEPIPSVKGVIILKDKNLKILRLSTKKEQQKENKLKTTHGFSLLTKFEKASPTTNIIKINNKESALMEVYNIKNNNYIKLRDLAGLLKDSDKEFNIEFNGDININTQKKYHFTKEEFTGKSAEEKLAKLSNIKLFINKEKTYIKGYVIDNHIYYKAKDISNIFNIKLIYNNKTNVVNLKLSNNKSILNEVIYRGVPRVKTKIIKQEKGMLNISNSDKNYKAKKIIISGNDKRLLEMLVQGEAGSEDYIGKCLVAQTIKDTMIMDGVVDVNTIKRTHGYFANYIQPDAETIKAVKEIFDEGKYVVKHRLVYFYAPKLCNSSFHESQNFVIEYGCHRFFDRW